MELRLSQLDYESAIKFPIISAGFVHKTRYTDTDIGHAREIVNSNR